MSVVCMGGYGIIHFIIIISIVGIIRVKLSIFISVVRTAVVGHLGLILKWLIGKWLIWKWLVGGWVGARNVGTRREGTRVYDIRWICCGAVGCECCREIAKVLYLLKDSNLGLIGHRVIFGVAAEAVSLDTSVVGRNVCDQRRRWFGIGT